MQVCCRTYNLTSAEWKGSDGLSFRLSTGPSLVPSSCYPRGGIRAKGCSAKMTTKTINGSLVSPQTMVYRTRSALEDYSEITVKRQDRRTRSSEALVAVRVMFEVDVERSPLISRLPGPNGAGPRQVLSPLATGGIRTWMNKTGIFVSLLSMGS